MERYELWLATEKWFGHVDDPESDVTHLIDVDLDFTIPGKSLEIGDPVLGSAGDYKIGLFISDPDEGAVVFERKTTSP